MNHPDDGYNGGSSKGMHVGSGGAGGSCRIVTSAGGAGGKEWADFFEPQRKMLQQRTEEIKMKWTEPEGYSHDKDEFDQLDDYASRWRLIVITLLAVALIIAGISAWRYVADCTQHFGTLDCALAWFYSFRT